ncbi:MAG: MMPL family transporter [Planctomycetaceae bacterium]
MFEKLGQSIVGWWRFILAAWVLLLVALFAVAPNWDDVVQDGEFAFLPADSESRLAEAAFAEAFPDDVQTSEIFVVIRRTSNSTGLIEDGDDDPEDEDVIDDWEFVRDYLAPEIREAVGFDRDSDEPPESDAAKPLEERLVVQDIKGFWTPGFGTQFMSFDNAATLIKIELRNEFLNNANRGAISAVEVVLNDIRYQKRTITNDDGSTEELAVVPPGLDLAISGNATFGRDILKAQVDSGKATEHWTRILVVILLLLIYRAPVLALIPLLTVSLATEITRKLLSILADFGWVDLFSGIDPYVTVVVYGAGVDYCLFLIARYKEELDRGATMNEAITSSMSRVGAAITASAGTVMCGIGMMVFAEFGKFQQAGVAITFGLAIVLLASLTFTPAFLRLFGKWAFWPNFSSERIEVAGGWVAPSSLMDSIRDRNLLRAGWGKIGQLLQERPGLIWTAAMLSLLPFAIIGVMFFSHLSYGLLTELPETSPSVRGTLAVQNHFPDGEVGPLKVLVRHPKSEFTFKGPEKKSIEKLTENLYAMRDELRLAKLRTWTSPTGLPEHPKAKKPGLARRSIVNNAVFKIFVSKVDPSATRIDVIPIDDPFSRDSIDDFNLFQKKFGEALPPELKDAEVSFVGATASVADLKTVTDRDQVRIDILVLVGVFLILVVLLRRPMISLYLIVSVFFSYLATLGLTFTVYYLMDPTGFAGLDWKVPIFLFTILIAVGEDYNIFLMTRIDEESEEHGRVKGITVALEKTGSIISSCGIIMAGTFASLLAGSLVGMDQLGFALASGVLLDTFVVRPILVPAYLILLHSGRLGRLGDFLGAKVEAPPAAPAD